MKCLLCEDCGWVCENHPDRPFEGEHACTCGGAGDPCPRCNAGDENTLPRPPDGFRTEVTSVSDRDVIFNSLKTAGQIIGEYLEPGHPRNAEATLNKLIEVLDNQELAAAIERLEKGPGLRVVK
jgi:hypothetical protein